ncbi:MAG: hypothetical protein Q8P80_00315, partial [Candidatus Levybacteria bacterium]|nr:hypothetical protein [Candidatus Levybacteria bacterium]
MLDGSIVSGPKKEFSVHVNIPKTLGSYYGDIEIELNGFPRSTELIDNNHQTLPIKITVVTLEPSDP